MRLGTTQQGRCIAPERPAGRNVAPVRVSLSVRSLRSRLRHVPSWRVSSSPAAESAGGVGTASPTAALERTSLVPDTLREMEQDTELQQHLAALAAAGQQALTRDERLKRQRSLDALGAPSFYATCQSRGVAPLKRSPARILQLNIGLYCNQACSHCHVESSPRRTAEQASRETVDRCLALLGGAATHGTEGAITTLDITGGAPELNTNFRYLVEQAAPLGVEIIDRCNLTVLLEPGQEDLVDFLARHKVRVVASLPCYSESNVDQQRGRGVFERSIAGLRLLNAAGYGVEGSGLLLDLVYNPGGAFLAPDQAKLEAAYKSELGSAYGIVFNRLLALNNMPIKRFADWLVRRDKLQSYMGLLVDNFNPETGASLMCRDTVSVRWDGTVYDCDFNQQLDMAIAQPGASASSRPLSIWDIQSLDELTGRPIRCDNHCYGCTAGSGSSCQGAVA
ncbi:hypothetical protein PLESTB_001360400 [Pleodorina starrii]|uniref:Fe-S oxidoreductase n=1 Tax=Pleodorina starrii TaxID=330485 RepID=A0A9W6BU27_9CHLO|nr:hypothetical protein PLESTM_002067200 [Pleodorina starrii]GLC58451.1 hypothetical protein PLESTB_001360400 [Pleodorina starrii]GLC77443.1 hypothetical protein PLESTF_001936600 [Pleodorina starrii]